MNRKYPNILSFFFGVPWAIRPEKLAEIQAVLVRRIERGAIPAAFEDDFASERRQQAERADAGYKLVGSAAVVPIQGTITPRPTLFADYSGGTSCEQIGRAVEAAANDPKAEHVVLDIDSPGGSCFGAPETWAKVFAARKLKPITAVANHEACSLAFGFATQAATVVVTPGGWVGSLGVIWPRTDETAMEEKLGLKTTMFVATGSPFKGEGRPDVPLTAEETAHRQQIVDTYYQQFLSAVSKGRGMKAEKIEKSFGGGRVVLADDALAAKMVDRIGTLEEIVGEVNGVRSGRMKRKVAAGLSRHGLPTASA